MADLIIGGLLVAGCLAWLIRRAILDASARLDTTIDGLCDTPRDPR